MKTNKFIKICFSILLLLFVSCVANIFFESSEKDNSITLAQWLDYTSKPEVFIENNLETDRQNTPDINSTQNISGQEQNNEWVLIKTPENLAYISLHYLEYATSQIRVINNLDFSLYRWIPIPSFSGVFDGMSCTISGLNVSVTTHAGLFATTTNATIKNVWIYDSVFIINNLSQNNYCGSVCAYSNNSTFNNCNSYNCTLSISQNDVNNSSYACGGIIGASKYDNIIFCKNYSNVFLKIKIPITQFSFARKSSYSYTGGIVGYCDNTSISLCTNSNSISNYVTNILILISFSFSTYLYSGGIAGYSSGTIEKCVNHGEIIAGNNFSSTESYAGGICGFSNNSINYCQNCGCVYSKSNGNRKESVSKEQKVYYKKISKGFYYDLFYSVASYTSHNPAYAGGIAGFSQSVIYNCLNTNSEISGGTTRIEHTFNYRIEKHTKEYFLFVKTNDNTEHSIYSINTNSIINKNYSQICGNAYNKNIYSCSVIEKEEIPSISYNFNITTENGPVTYEINSDSINITDTLNILLSSSLAKDDVQTNIYKQTAKGNYYTTNSYFLIKNNVLSFIYILNNKNNHKVNQKYDLYTYPTQLSNPADYTNVDDYSVLDTSVWQVPAYNYLNRLSKNEIPYLKELFFSHNPTSPLVTYYT